MGLREIYIRIAGETVRIHSGSSEFIWFVENNFGTHIVEATDQYLVECSFDLDSPDCRGERVFVSNGAYFSGDILVSRETEGAYFYKVTRDQMSVSFRPASTFTLRPFLKRVKLGVSPVGVDFFWVFRRLVLFSVFYALERFRGKFVSHACAFEFKSKVFFVPGAANVGKSSLALAALLDGGRLLGDNYIVYDGQRVFGVAEALRIDGKGCGETLLSKRQYFMARNSRRFCPVASEEVMLEAEPDVTLLPALGERFSIDKVSPASAARSTVLTSMHVNELHYTSPVCMLDRVGEGGDEISFCARESTMNSLINKSSAYSVTIGRNQTPLENLNKISEVIGAEL